MAQPLPVPGDLGVARLSVEQYHAMIETGILESGDRIELLDGLLVPQMTKNTPHVVAGKLASRELARVLPAGFHVQTQDPVTTADSEPEPDVAVVRGDPRDYSHAKPRAAEVPLVVEVADESLERDRGTKLRVYARAGIREYWILNLRDRVVERYREPAGEAYGARTDYAAGTRVPVVVDGTSAGEIEIDAMLP